MACPNNSRVSKSTKSQPVLRRSARLHKTKDHATQSSHLLPSPPLSRSQAQSAPKKRPHADCDKSTDDNEPDAKRRALQDILVPSSHFRGHPIAFWAVHHDWPELYRHESTKMSAPPNIKRKSSSTHHSDRQQRLEQNGIYLETSAQLQQKSKEFCNTLLKGETKPDQFPCYPIERVDDVLRRVQRYNEARLQRDVTPWVVPSAEDLVLSGKLVHDYVGEEVQAEWIRCEPMGSSRPKPDITVGLGRDAFTTDEWARLDNSATSATTFYCTPNVSFPFLMCEVKTDRTGLGTADVQNIHSGSIAVRSILRLLTAAYGPRDQRVQDLLGRVLVFSVSHDHQHVNIYGHYAIARENGDNQHENFEYFRHGIAMFSFQMFNGEQRYCAYNFVRNLYDKFIPEHRDRLRDAIKNLKEPQQRTGPSFETASAILNDNDGSQLNQPPFEEVGIIFKTPSEPASAASRRFVERFERERNKAIEQSDKLLAQLERQRLDSRENEERMLRQMEEQLERQRLDSREKEERMMRQMEEQQKESREKEERMMRQMGQIMNMISAPGEAKGTEGDRV